MNYDLLPRLKSWVSVRATWRPLYDASAESQHILLLFFVKTDSSCHVSARPESALRIAKLKLFFDLKYLSWRTTLEQLRCSLLVRAFWQLCNAVHMLRHDLQGKQLYAVPVSCLPYARRNKIFVLFLLHHLIPVFCAPFYVPHASPYAMIVPS